MPNRLTKIYTRTGDDGYTRLREHRLWKDEPLVAAVGDLDELNSALGMVLASPINERIAQQLKCIQNELFDIGGELHTPLYHKITATEVTRLEEELDEWNAQLSPLEEFILPGGHLPAATLHLARTICRRAERSLVHLHRQQPLANSELLRYLNRLSDLLFVLARKLTQENHQQEVLWNHQKE